MSKFKDETLTVGLLWHSVNSDNLGVGALTTSNITILRKIASKMGLKLSALVIGWRDPGPVYVSGPDIEAVPIRTRDLFKPGGVYKALKRCDIVIDISTGDAFSDIYGQKRIAKNFVGKLTALLAGKPLLIAPQTIGPFKSAWTNLVAGALMRRASLVATRDHLSTEAIAHLSLGDRQVEATDVAMCLPYDATAYPCPPHQDGQDRVRIGLNVSGLLYNGGYTGKNEFGLSFSYKDLIDELIGKLLERPDVQLHLVGHVNSAHMEVEDDYRVCEKLAAERPGTVLAPRFKSPEDAKSYISSLDYFAGARMHACIAAFSSGVPVMPMAYSRKFIGLFGSLKYPQVADCRTASADEILSAVINGLDSRAALKAQVDSGLHEALRRLEIYERRLESIIKSVKDITTEKAKAGD